MSGFFTVSGGEIAKNLFYLKIVKHFPERILSQFAGTDKITVLFVPALLTCSNGT